MNDNEQTQAMPGALQNNTLQLVSVRFQPAGKPYHFAADNNIALSADAWVVVKTIYGLQVGQVTKVGPLEKDINTQELKQVIRRASGLDMAQYQVMQERAERMVLVAREEVKNSAMDVKIVSTEFTLDGKNALVLCTGNLTAPNQKLLKRRLSSRMSCRVELRTIGPRDQAKALGGYGVCGEPRCCARFLTDFQAVSIRMAKTQSISMAPSDITGMCGRLRCCLAYEHDVYKAASEGFPKRKSRVMTEKGEGKIIDWDILKGQVIVEVPPDGPRGDRERLRIPVEEVEVISN